MSKFKFALVTTLALTACGSDPFMNPYGGSADDQLNNANIEITKYKTKPTAEMVAIHNVENALKEYQEKNNVIGLGNAYNTYGKIFRVMEHNFAKDIEYQNKAISYYQQKNYNPGLAVSYADISEAKYLSGDKAGACTNVNLAIQKFEEMKTTHPGIQIPMYNPNFKDFGDFNRHAKVEMGCAN